MSRDPKFETIAKAIRMEHDQNTGTIFLVFEVVDEKFKRKMLDNWAKEDIELIIKEKNADL